MRPNEKPGDSKTSSVGNKKDSPPAYDEIEVSLFGPGYGESALIHVGENKWIIVDSCIDPTLSEPAPLAYLRRIDVNPNTAVKQVIASHWHDDHVRGLADIFRECKVAEFVCSAALNQTDFLTLVNSYGKRSLMKSTGVKEFYDTINLLKKRSVHRDSYTPPKFALAGRYLWPIETVSDLGYPFAIYSLSPSDHSILLAQMRIAQLIPQISDTKRRVPSFSPNHAAVVLLIVIGNDSILLGSDLEENGDPRTGWSFIINSRFITGKSSFFKIPHHGSITADHPQVWSLLLDSEPFSVLTPFAIGKTFLPTKNDVTRIQSMTSRAYSTGLPKQLKSKNRPKMVEKQIKEIGINLRQVYHSIGHVRARGRYHNNRLEWTVHLLGGALPLNHIYK